MAENWIRDNLTISSGGDEVIFPINNEIRYSVSIFHFLLMFGESIEKAINDGADVGEAIIASDPDNVYGYNSLIDLSLKSIE